MRRLEQVVTLFAHSLVRGQTDYCRAGWIHERHVIVRVDRHNRRGDRVQVVDLLGSRLFLLGLFGHVDHELDSAFDVTFGVFDRRAGILDRHEHTVPWPGKGFAGYDRIGFHGLGAGALFGFAVGRFEQIIAFLADRLVRHHPGRARAGWVDVGDGEQRIDLQHRRWQHVQVALGLLEQVAGGNFLVDVLDVDQCSGKGLVVKKRDGVIAQVVDRFLVGLPHFRDHFFFYTLGFVHGTILGSAQVMAASLFVIHLAVDHILIEVEIVQKGFVGTLYRALIIQQHGRMLHIIDKSELIAFRAH